MTVLSLDILEESKMGISEANRKLLYATINKVILDDSPEAKLLEQDCDALVRGFKCDTEICQAKLRNGIITEEEFINKMSKLTIDYYNNRYNLAKHFDIVEDHGALALSFKKKEEDTIDE